MNIACAWCGKGLGSKPSVENTEELVSHGICEDCSSALLGAKKTSLKDFLDSLKIPVLVVGIDVTVHYANKHAREILHKEMPSIEGLCGGDVFECMYAKQEGCGKTTHCVGCSIRISVTDTYNTSIKHLRTPAYLIQGSPYNNHEVKFLISTEKISDVVFLRIDKVGEH